MANKKLSAVITIGGAVAGSLKSAFSSTQSRIGLLGASIGKLTRQQKLLGSSIQEFGRLGKDVDGMRQRYSALGMELGRLRTQYNRLASSKRAAERIGGIAKGASIAAAAGAAASVVVSRPLIKSAIERENVVTAIRNSGVSKAEADEMIRTAASSKQFGVSVTRATGTVSELRTALGDAHHAIEALPTALKAISGLQLYDRLHHSDMASGDSAYQMAKVAEERGGASDPASMRDKFNWAFKALTGSNGKVSIADQLTAVRTGKGAVQAMSDEAFFGDTFLQQSMGADRYGTSNSTLVNAWIGGHQKNTAFEHLNEMGLLREFGADGKRLFGRDKNGNVNKVSPDALVDAQAFLKDPQKWVDDHLMPLAKTRGVDVNDPAALMSFVGAIASNPNAANLLLSRMRFSANIWKDRRNVMQANGIDKSDEANQKSTQGRIDNAAARMDDVSEHMGKVLLPILATAMEGAASALEWLNKAADESPTAFKAMTFALVGGAGLLAAITAVGVVVPMMTKGFELTSIAVTALSGKTASLATASDVASVGIGGLVGSLIGKAGLVFALSSVALEVAKLLGLPDVNREKGQDALKRGDWWAASAYLPAGEFISAARDHLFSKKTMIDTGPEGFASNAGGAAFGNPHISGGAGLPMPAMSTAQTPQTINNTTNVGGITVNAPPGADAKQVADEVTRLLKRQQSIDSGNRMFDGANQ